MKEKLFKKGITRRLFSVVLALVMIITLMPVNSMMVYAGGSAGGTGETTATITVLDNGTLTGAYTIVVPKGVVQADNNFGEDKLLSGVKEEETLYAAYWHVVKGTANIDTLKVSGDSEEPVNIILAKNSTLNVKKIVGDSYGDGYLRIWQEVVGAGENIGKLIVGNGENGDGNFAIWVRELTINGGDVKAIGGNYGYNEYMEEEVVGDGIFTDDKVYINGGIVEAIGGSNGGEYCCGNGIHSKGVYINGGTLEATGGSGEDIPGGYGLY